MSIPLSIKKLSDVLSGSMISFHGDCKLLSNDVNTETSLKKETSEPLKDDSYLTTTAPLSDDPFNKENAFILSIRTLIDNWSLQIYILYIYIILFKLSVLHFSECIPP